MLLLNVADCRIAWLCYNLCPMLIPNKQLFLFDFDGTLMDSSLDILASINHTRHKLALPALTFEQARKYIGIGQQALVEGVMEDSAVTVQEAISIYQEHHEQHMYDHVRFYPGIPELLTELLRQGKTLGIVSNKYSQYIHKILAHVGNNFDFSVIIGPDTLKTRKPDPTVIHHACTQTQNTISQTVMIGDSIIDIQAGQNAQVTSVACLWGFNTREELAVAAPDFFINTPQELLIL